VLFRKEGEKISREELWPVRFVPVLTGTVGNDEEAVS